MGKVVDETQHQIVLADEPHGYGHKASLLPLFALSCRGLELVSPQLISTRM